MILYLHLESYMCLYLVLKLSNTWDWTEHRSDIIRDPDDITNQNENVYQPLQYMVMSRNMRHLSICLHLGLSMGKFQFTAIDISKNMNKYPPVI